MFICYCDESCSGDAPEVTCVVGILVNTYSMHRTRRELEEIVDPIEELKARDLYGGRGDWQRVAPEDRKTVCRGLIAWLTGRKCVVVPSVVLHSKFSEARQRRDWPGQLTDPYITAACHVVAAAARRGAEVERSGGRNKGKTVIVMDEQKRWRDVARIITQRPAWLGDYFSRQLADLDTIVDSPYSALSESAPLLWAADLLAFMIRRWIELQIGHEERFEEEKAELENVNTLIGSATIEPRHMFPRGSRAAQVFELVGADSIAGLLQ